MKTIYSDSSNNPINPEELKATVKALKEFQKALNISGFEFKNLFIEGLIEGFETSYNTKLDSINGFLEKRGYVKPNDKRKFFEWFWNNKINTQANKKKKAAEVLDNINLTEKELIEFSFLVTKEFEKYLESLNSKTGKEIKPKKKKLNLNQIAIINIYNKEIIERGENANGIAKKHGYKSGEKLYQNYTHYVKRENRIYPETTKLKSKNKLELLESTLQYIKPEYQDRAKDEFKLLKQRIEQDF